MERITFSQVEHLTRDMNPTMARLVSQTCDDINHAENKIRDGLRSMASTMARIESELDRGAGLNSLGEFQRTPVEVDQAIAAREAAWRQLARLIGQKYASELAAGRA